MKLYFRSAIPLLSVSWRPQDNSVLYSCLRVAGHLGKCCLSVLGGEVRLHQYIHWLRTADLFVLLCFACTCVLGKSLLSAVFMHLTCVGYLILRDIYTRIVQLLQLTNIFILPRSMSPNLSNRSSPLTFNVVNHTSGTDCPDPFANGADIQISNIDYRLSRKELQQNLQEIFSRHGKVKVQILLLNPCLYSSCICI